MSNPKGRASRVESVRLGGLFHVGVKWIPVKQLGHFMAMCGFYDSNDNEFSGERKRARWLVSPRSDCRRGRRQARSQWEVRQRCLIGTGNSISFLILRMNGPELVGGLDFGKVEAHELSWSSGLSRIGDVGRPYALLVQLALAERN